MAFEFEFSKKDEFKFDEFVHATGWSTRRRFRNTCSSRFESSDYHLHLRWRITPPESVSVAMEFVQGYKKPDEDEAEPFAEDFINWFKEFLLAKELPADVYCDFEYPTDPHRKLRFPLPMRAPVGPEQVDVEIDGISFKLSPPVRGIEKVWVTQGKEHITIHLHARKKLQISSLDPRKEVLEISEVLESLFDRGESSKVSE